MAAPVTRGGWSAQAGVNCGEHCKCDACLNTPEHGPPPAPKPTKSRARSGAARAAAAARDAAAAVTIAPAPGRPTEKSPGTPPVKAAAAPGNPNPNAPDPDPRRGSARKQRRPLPAAAPSGVPGGAARAAADYWLHAHANGGALAGGRGAPDAGDASASPGDSGGEEAGRASSPDPNPGAGELASPERLKDETPEGERGPPEGVPGGLGDLAAGHVLTMGAAGPYVLVPCAAKGGAAGGAHPGCVTWTPLCIFCIYK